MKLSNLFKTPASLSKNWWDHLPAECAWMKAIAQRHNAEYEAQADKSNVARCQRDADLFFDLVMEARNEKDPRKQGRRYWFITNYWPLARTASRQ